MADVKTKPQKSTTESQHRIDIRWMKRQGYLPPGTGGTLSWSNRGKHSGSIGFNVTDDHMVLNYRYRPHGGEWEEVEQIIQFNRTPCNYGGQRVWFLCPRCRKRVAILYGAGEDFWCRHCHNLTYSTQQEPTHERLMSKAQNIRRKLGGNGSLTDCFPPKPKNMHWRTYWRMRDESEQAEILSWKLINQKLGITGIGF